MYFQGIDPISLDMLAREGIVALRRAKRRNMERYDHQESFLKSFFNQIGHWYDLLHRLSKIYVTVFLCFMSVFDCTKMRFLAILTLMVYWRPCTGINTISKNILEQKR